MERLPESVIQLGPGKSLVGIATPAVGAPAWSSPICALILNAGIIHRVGPNRLGVELARLLARRGVPAVRFDLAGIGDSASRSDGLAPLDAALADIRDAMDSITAARGARRFVLIGLCSGANHAIISAGSDERIAAVALMDPFIPRTRHYYFNHYIGRMTRVTSWRNFLRGDHPLWHWLRDRAVGRDKDAVMTGGPEMDRVREYLQNVYLRAVDRGVRILAVFTGDLEAQHNDREQLIDAFPAVSFGANLELHYFEHADHTFSAEADRRRLIDAIVEWSGRLA